MQVDPGIFKAYDIRGIYPEQLNEDIAYALGRSFAVLADSNTIIVGQDMRASGDSLTKKFAQGITDQGKNVLMIGQVSTDCSYFASGEYNMAAAMFTASHNPAEYNGVKFSLAGAVPVSENTGIKDMQKMIADESWPEANAKGKIENKNILPEYIEHALSFVDQAKIKNLKIAVDAGNGMAGHIMPLVQSKLDCEFIEMYYELDGSFPNHEANPIKPENVADLIEQVKNNQADIGLAFDGDADRVFFIDEKGNRISSSLITALVAKQMLVKYPGSKIIYNVPCSKIIPETVKANAGTAIKERVGHSFIKATMKEQDAVFGGEHSGHYYFQNNYFADSGLIAALIVLEILVEKNKSFSEVLAEYQKYYGIEETNSEVQDKDKKIAELKQKYSDAKIEEIDGITFEYDDYWFNVRASNTEPVLRLNLEANTEELKDEKSQEILNIIRDES